MSEARRILVKVGGAILDDPATRAAFAESVGAARAAGRGARARPRPRGTRPDAGRRPDGTRTAPRCGVALFLLIHTR